MTCVACDWLLGVADYQEQPEATVLLRAAQRAYFGSRPPAAGFETLDQKTSRIVVRVTREIAEAFESVARGPMTIAVGQLHDSYVYDAEAIDAATRHDGSSRWQEIPAERLADGVEAPSYFDAQSFVFHLPAYLTHLLRCAPVASFGEGRTADVAQTIFRALTRHHGEWVDLLTLPQRRALCSFLGAVLEVPDLLGERAIADEAAQALSWWATSCESPATP